MTGSDRLATISVVTIFLNGERFLPEAIESVRSQSFRDWELLLVDDGSSDGSAAIARAAAAVDERICYLTHPGGVNRGMSASRNRGLAAATGTFVAFLDADDVFLPVKLERQLAVLEREPRAAMTYGPTRLWYGWTGRQEDVARDRPSKLGVEPETLVEPPDLLLRLLSREAWPPATCSVLVRRAAVEDVGGFEDRFTDMFEDQAFFYKLLARHPAYVEANTHDLYRQHDDSWKAHSLRAGTWRGRGPSPSHRALVAWLRGELSSEATADARIASLLDEACRPYDHPVRYRVSAAARRLQTMRTRVSGRFGAR